MSEKKRKAERRAIRELTTGMAPLKPIYQAAYEELNDDMELLMKWATFALGVHALCPHVPLSRLLPRVLDQTISEMKDELAARLDGVEKAKADRDSACYPQS